MSEWLESIENLITKNMLLTKSGEEIIEEIHLKLYNPENFHLREKDTFYKLPEVVRDIILVIDFDTEVTMQGILGFLENSTGLYLDETISTLKKIQAEEDCHILKEIRSILTENNISTYDLRANVNKGELYSITSFLNTHREKYEKVAEEIGELADKLYLSSEDRNLFNNLIEYVEKKRHVLIEELTNQ